MSLARAQVKQIVDEHLEGLADQIIAGVKETFEREFKPFRARLGNVETRLGNVEADLAEIKADVKKLLAKK